MKNVKRFMIVRVLRLWKWTWIATTNVEIVLGLYDEIAMIMKMWFIYIYVYNYVYKNVALYELYAIVWLVWNDYELCEASEFIYV